MKFQERLRRSKDRMEEKSVTLRIPQNKVAIMEILAKEFDMSISSLIREMIDEAIVKLAKDNYLLSEEAGMIHVNKKGEKHNIRCFSDVVGFLAPELEIKYDEDDVKTQKDIDRAIYEMLKLSYEYGFSVTDSWPNPDENHEDNEYGEVLDTFTKKTKVKE